MDTQRGTKQRGVKAIRRILADWSGFPVFWSGFLEQFSGVRLPGFSGVLVRFSGFLVRFSGARSTQEFGGPFTPL